MKGQVVQKSTTCRLKEGRSRNGAIRGVCHLPFDGVTEIGKTIAPPIVSTNIDSVTAVIITQIDLIATLGNEATDIGTGVAIPEGNSDISTRVPQGRPTIICLDFNGCVLSATLTEEGITDLYIAVSVGISSSRSCSGNGDSEQRDCAEEQRKCEEEGYDFLHSETPFF